MNDHAKPFLFSGRFGIAGLRAVLPTEATRPQAFYATAETIMAGFTSLPFTLAKAKIIHTTKINQLIEREALIITQCLRNFQPVIYRHVDGELVVPALHDPDPLSKAAGELI